MVKLQYDSKQYKLTLPKAIVEAKGWKKGDILEIKIDDHGDLIITKKKKHSKTKK